MRKEAKKCIKYYIDNISTRKFKNYIEQDTESSLKTHRKYVETEHPEWKNRTDYFEDYDIAEIVFSDVLSNAGVTKLLKKLYSLPKNKFKVNNNYKQPKLGKQYDYVHLQYSSKGSGRLAQIEFLKDPYIKDIEITWSQINNYFAYIEYEICFKKCLNDELYDQFILDNIKNLTSKDYLIWYFVRDDFDDNCMWLKQMHEELFEVICQHYITSLLYSEVGKENLLINLKILVRKDPINIDTIYLGDLSVSYYNKNNNYIISGDFDATSFSLFSGNNRIPNFSLCGYISEFGNNLYYKLFGTRELRIFEHQFSKFVTGRKKISYNKSFKYLLNKFQSLTDDEYPVFGDIEKEINEKWDFYISNEKESFDKWHFVGAEKVKNVYQKNFDYLKLLIEMNYTKSNKILSVIATITSVLATIISIVAIVFN